MTTLTTPISFTANVIRVVVLTLITYHFGDAGGQVSCMDLQEWCCS